MNDKLSSRNQTSQGHIAGEGPFLKSLCEFWKPHQRTDLENRYNLGVMLNIKLGDPKVRQKHPGTIRRISKELSIDKSDISRMRRFAVKYESFEAFMVAEPDVHSWTQVRIVIAKSKAPKTSTDSRASWSTTRSLKSLIERFSSDHDFSGPQADEIRCALRELFSLAQAKLGIDLD